MSSTPTTVTVNQPAPPAAVNPPVSNVPLILHVLVVMTAIAGVVVLAAIHQLVPPASTILTAAIGISGTGTVYQGALLHSARLIKLVHEVTAAAQQPSSVTVATDDGSG